MEMLLQGLRWLTQVETKDQDLERRGRITISLLFCFMALALLSIPVLLALVEEGRTVILTMNVGFLLVIATITGIIRKGYVDLGGTLSSMGMSIILAMGVLGGSADAFDEVGWFFAVSILIASYAVRARFIVWITLFNIGLLGGLGYYSYLNYATDPGNMVSMQILVIMLAVSSYLYSTQTQRMFQRLFSLNNELEEARREAIGASEAKTTFLANMSHELRTPLNAILGYTELLQEEFEEDADSLDPEQALQDLAQVHRAGHHLLDLINDVLNLSRVLSGRSDLNLTPFSLNRLLDEIVPIMRPMALERGNTLHIEAENVCQLHSDERKVRQILLNLLSNAIKFTQNGDIYVRLTRPTPEVARIEIQDTGLGIAPDLQSRLFRAFERVAKEDPTIGGTGLGLVLSREFAVLLGGNVSFESVHGEGSTFWVELAMRCPMDATEDAPVPPRELAQLA